MGNQNIRANVIERLWQRSHGDSDDECWEAEFKPCSHGGHCQIRLDDTTKVFIHRLAWEAHHAEPVPEGLYVLHHCDNPCCFNPAHLYVGTLQDNSNDRVKRQRQNATRDPATGQYIKAQ